MERCSMSAWTGGICSSCVVRNRAVWRKSPDGNTLTSRYCAISRVSSYHQHGRKRLSRCGPSFCRTGAVSVAHGDAKGPRNLRERVVNSKSPQEHIYFMCQ
jgi:hypothetical protein